MSPSKLDIAVHEDTPPHVSRAVWQVALKHHASPAWPDSKPAEALANRLPYMGRLRLGAEGPEFSG
jgi:hypothetical protein